ncbi:MAG: DUF6242 domain-containing protein [Dysgonamonadaceae bacterium]|jgi:hypothetical protein|nr:DUF6242 domain-containing protein [Dysgonamonadaceae bacterium]
MNLRIGFYGLCFMALFSVLGSCLNGDDVEYVLPTDAQITAFSISHDSVPLLDSILFTIDQFNGLIYNHDSIRYGTVIPEKVIATYTSGAYGIMDITRLAEGDSAVFTSGDSLDVSTPVQLKVYAYDGSYKYYQINVNVYQIDPDSMRYSRLTTLPLLDVDAAKAVYIHARMFIFTKTGVGAVKLYSSSSGADWTELSISGLPDNTVVSEIQQVGDELFAYTEDGKLFRSFDAQTWSSISTEYPVEAMLGYIGDTPLQTACYALLVKKDGRTVFASTPDLLTWSYGEEVPANFPVVGFSSLKTHVMAADRITLVGGTSGSGAMLNSCWSTTNGIYWAKITDNNKGVFPLMTGMNVFIYDDCFYLMNGLTADGVYNREIYRSIDGGVTWQLAPEKVNFPEAYSGRYGASTVVDEDNNIYIIGGKNQQVLTDIWVGILNKLSYK